MWLLLSALGCMPHIDDATFEAHTLPPAPAESTLEFKELRITEGAAVAFVVRPLRRGQELPDRVAVELRSADEEVLGVNPIMDADRRYLLYGVKSGNAEVEVYLNGRLERTIPARVESL